MQLPGEMQRMQLPGEMQRPVEITRSSYPFTQPSSAIHNVLHRPLQNPVAGPPPPSAAEYVPPTVFLQQLTNPQNTVIQPKSVPDYFNR